MTVKIDKKIVDYRVISPEAKLKEEQERAQKEEQRKQDNIVHMHESVERPETLLGSTYKIKTPESEHAMYITINDIVLNMGTEHEQRRPFEIFINSKNMEHFQWILALTRITSAVFRKGGDITFLVEEMRAVFDPKGGYWKKGGRFVPSLVAEIGDVIEEHLRKLGMMKTDEMSDRQLQLLKEKRVEYEAQHSGTSEELTANEDSTEARFPASASLCKKCSTKAVILMDGCMTCLSCGDSKCG